MIMTATKNMCFKLEENEVRNVTQIIKNLRILLDTIEGEGDYDTTFEVSKEIKDLIHICITLDYYI